MGLKAHAFTETAKAECVAPTALGIRRPCYPALPGGATFFRASGAPIDESRFLHGLLRLTHSPERTERSLDSSAVADSGRRLISEARLAADLGALSIGASITPHGVTLNLS